MIENLTKKKLKQNVYETLKKKKSIFPNFIIENLKL